jgi:hypothetical protein
MTSLNIPSGTEPEDLPYLYALVFYDKQCITLCVLGLYVNISITLCV